MSDHDMRDFVQLFDRHMSDLTHQLRLLTQELVHLRQMLVTDGEAQRVAWEDQQRAAIMGGMAR